jgi:outer membrane protein
MKRIMLMLSTLVLGAFAINAMAADVGVINMRTIFQSAPQVQQINENLKKDFAVRREAIVTMGKQLQADVQDYQKNKAVMSKANLEAVQKKITALEGQVRQKQVQFQQDLYAAQNKHMEEFMNKVRGIVKSIAADKKLTLVLPENAVLYSQDDMDITKEVIAKLK